MALTDTGKIRYGSGRSAARLACLLRKQEVGSSNLPAPTIQLRETRFAFVAGLFFLAIAIFSVSDSAQASKPKTTAQYTVVSGDNLTFIAKRFGTTISSLKKNNHLSSDVLAIGQKLKIVNPLKKPRVGKIKWKYACNKTGKVLRPFGKYKEKNILMARTGVDLSCPAASPVKAPAVGIVRYIGPLEGFGTVIILEHFGGYSSVFSPLDKSGLKVKQGDAVNQGQVLGSTGKPVMENSPPYLHIELRKNKTAIKPNVLHH